MTHFNDIIVCEPRTYRSPQDGDDFVSFRVLVETSDLFIRALNNLSEQARNSTVECRAQIEDAIRRRPEFLTSYKPMKSHEKDSPVVIRMINASKKAGVGPMAAVAGAVAEFVGRNLLRLSDEVIVENGGDVFIHVKREITVGVFTGASIFNGRIGIKVGPTSLPIGICTSSSKVGPSTSLGRAEAATVVSSDTSLADAVATALGNRLMKGSDLKAAVSWATSIDGVVGALAIIEDKMAVSGDVELTPINQNLL
ncbi:MAG: UPF0280 family protein [Pseudomonadota bacterium]